MLFHHTMTDATASFSIADIFSAFSATSARGENISLIHLISGSGYNQEAIKPLENAITSTQTLLDAYKRIEDPALRQMPLFLTAINALTALLSAYKAQIATCIICTETVTSLSEGVHHPETIVDQLASACDAIKTTKKMNAQAFTAMMPYTEAQEAHYQEERERVGREREGDHVTEISVRAIRCTGLTLSTVRDCVSNFDKDVSVDQGLPEEFYIKLTLNDVSPINLFTELVKLAPQALPFFPGI